jgi:transposase
MRADSRDPSDVTDEPWEVLPAVLPERTWGPGGPGRPPWDVRRRGNGIRDVNTTGGHWRLGPQAWGHWHTSEGDGTRWRRDGVWARVRETRSSGGATWPATTARARRWQHGRAADQDRAPKRRPRV